MKLETKVTASFSTQRQTTQTQLSELRAEVASLQSSDVPATVPTEGTAATQISQVTMGTARASVTGGRNQQSSRRD